MHKPAVIGIVEVKPKNPRYELQECEMAIDRYDIFTLEEEGRGVCLYAKQDLRPTLVTVDNSFKESVFIKCQLDREENAIFGLLYRSPNSTDENNKQLNTTLQTAAEIPTNHLIIMGDFNYPDIDWENERSTVGDERAASIFYKATKDAFFIQHQMAPTRFRNGQQPKLDDLVFTNREDILLDITRTGALGKSDHVTLLVDLACTQNTPRAEETTAQLQQSRLHTDEDVLRRN